ncbi:MAG: cupin domain-containing protein [Pseudomonadota bacterium]
MKTKHELHAITKAVATNAAPYELSQKRRNSLAQRIMSRIGGPAPKGTETLRREEGQWVHVMDRVTMKVLRQDSKGNNHTVLYRLQAGAVFPSHFHDQEEECYVIEGDIRIGGHVLVAGDWHLAKPGFDHPTIESRHGALLLVRSQID